MSIALVTIKNNGPRDIRVKSQNGHQVIIDVDDDIDLNVYDDRPLTIELVRHEKVEMFANLFTGPAGGFVMGTQVYYSKAAAKKDALGPRYVDTVKVREEMRPV